MLTAPAVLTAAPVVTKVYYIIVEETGSIQNQTISPAPARPFVHP
jgi:hypothetical protein